MIFDNIFQRIWTIQSELKNHDASSSQRVNSYINSGISMQQHNVTMNILNRLLVKGVGDEVSTKDLFLKHNHITTCTPTWMFSIIMN